MERGEGEGDEMADEVIMRLSKDKDYYSTRAESIQYSIDSKAKKGEVKGREKGKVVPSSACSEGLRERERE